MLRVFKASGEEALAIQLVEFVEKAGEQQVRAIDVKRHLQALCGQTRFKQRLVLSDGQVLSDDVAIVGPMDLQLILLPFDASSHDQIQQLQRHACNNDVTAMEQLLQRPQDPDLPDSFFEGLAALNAACGHGRIEAAHLLLEANADKDKASNFGETALFAASHGGHHKVVKLLLEVKADKDKADCDGRSPMYVASEEGHLEVVKMLLAAKAAMDRAQAFGETPLYVAALRCESDVVRLLLDAKADKNKADNEGASPMLVASRCGHFEVIRLLLEAKASYDHTSNTSTLVYLASRKGHVEVVRLLQEQLENHAARPRSRTRSPGARRLHLDGRAGYQAEPR